MIRAIDSAVPVTTTISRVRGCRRRASSIVDDASKFAGTPTNPDGNAIVWSVVELTAAKTTGTPGKSSARWRARNLTLAGPTAKITSIFVAA
jgi:hypothetical protein